MDTRGSYDALASTYAAHFADELDAKPLDRALLAALAEMVGPGAPVADVGCGPGHLAAHLRRLGLQPRGFDLSPGMVEEARRRHPEVAYEVASMLALPLADASMAAVVAFYSVIHLDPEEELPRALAEFHRVLRPGGVLLISFHAGNERRHTEEMLGVPVDLDFHFHLPDVLAARVEGAGLRVAAVLQRRAYTPLENDTRRAYLMATKPDAD